MFLSLIWNDLKIFSNTKLNKSKSTSRSADALSCPNLKKTKEWVAAATDNNNQEDAVAAALDTVALATAMIEEVVRATA